MTAINEWQERVIDRVVRDDVLALGPQRQLIGILSRAATTRADAGATPALIILNAGVLHRVGPHRLHVNLGRRIAATGISSLRLDLGGIGDSITTSDAASFRDSAVADTREAMTGLAAEVGATRFVLFGVCAGADNSIATALVDDRVAGIVLVDPPAYPTRRGQLRHLRAQIAEHGPRDVVRWATRSAARRLGQAAALLRRRVDEEPPTGGRELPTVTTFHDQLTRLVARGVRILTVYSGIHGIRYNHPDQLYELFPELRGRVDTAYFPTANHTFTELASQAELIAAVTGWMQKHFD
jgi:hypothetical protein